MSSFSTNELWIVSAPGEAAGGTQETWERLQAATQNMSTNSKFNIPDLKVFFSENLVKILINNRINFSAI